MSNLSYIKGLSHHAYCLVSLSVAPLISILKEHHDIEPQGNPDFFHGIHEVFGIEESRRLKELHSSKSFTSGGKRIFIIECSNITLEAQNSLLKIFEEPHENVHFFVVIPSASILLPTLRSRLHIIENQRKELGGLEEAKRFIKMSTKDKIEFVDDLAKRISDEENTKKDALEFLSALESILGLDVENNNRSLEALLKARSYMNDRSPSIKQLLEFVALSI